MELLRGCCLISVILTAIIGASAYAHDVAIAALVPLCFGVLALVVILPFAAYERVRRSRVLIACVFYTAATVITGGIANVFDRSEATYLLCLPPLIGVMLSFWALKTRNRRRRVGFSNYYDA
ncbi:hypothetical protein [Sphingomonas sp. 8AM]|uniref:hypothetical protein n=1 Tax=Sphingomonas sp. 8AM TaxID=2653170 RepID=UPI0012F3610D|nr:hypothetical protein [Sphingomonas sp. 8AM]VXC92808.1 conserved membrane hypothetical protein [Sphingomonas sp. 8AM]